jgi:PPIC-type PPIASE domain
MSNQTLRKPPARSSSAARKAVPAARSRRQTALGGSEFRRDGTPLLFGWGAHLTRIEKQRVQTRATYGLFGLIIVAVVGVFVFGVIQQNILIPNEAIVTVNSTSITQDTYRKYLAYEAQVLWNRLQSEIKQEQQLATKGQAGDTNAQTQDQIMISQIQSDEADYQQSSITQNLPEQLVEDQLIQQGMAKFEAHGVPASKFAVTSSAIQAQLTSFEKSFPSGQTYQGFKSKDHVSDDDVRAAIAVDLRRNVMQKYLASLIVSPTNQIHMRRIQLDTASKAAQVRAQLVKNPSDANWTTLAKADSLDAATKTVGGDMGWVFQGGTDAAIENWAFGSGIKVSEISPVIKDSSGTFDVVQVLGIDPHRTVDASTLASAQGNALDHWLAGQKVAQGVKISSINSGMETASRNLPAQPNLNATLPNYNPNANGSGTGTTP